jgi:hypothetical protein
VEAKKARLNRYGVEYECMGDKKGRVDKEQTVLFVFRHKGPMKETAGMLKRKGQRDSVHRGIEERKQANSKPQKVRCVSKSAFLSEVHRFKPPTW